MKTLFKVSSLALLASSAAFAGTAEVSAPSSAPSVAPSSDPWLSASASLGYESAYYFRGLWFSNNNFFGGVNLSAPLTEKLTLGVGALYTQTARATEVFADQTLDYSEMDLFASLAYATDFATFTLSATHYQFFDTFSGSAGSQGPYAAGLDDDLNVTEATDFGLGMVKNFGDFNFYLSAFYDVRIDGCYFETAIDYTYAVNDKFSLVPVIQTGYGIEYYYGYDAVPQDAASDGEGFTHIRTAITAPYKATDSLTITPYIANNHSLETRKIQNQYDQSRSEIYGGITASYSF